MIVSYNLNKPDTSFRDVNQFIESDKNMTYITVVFEVMSICHLNPLRKPRPYFRGEAFNTFDSPLYESQSILGTPIHNIFFICNN